MYRQSRVYHRTYEFSKHLFHTLIYGFKVCTWVHRERNKRDRPRYDIISIISLRRLRRDRPLHQFQEKAPTGNVV